MGRSGGKHGRTRYRRMMEYKAKVTELITNGVPYEEARAIALAYVKGRKGKRGKK